MDVPVAEDEIGGAMSERGNMVWQVSETQTGFAVELMEWFRRAFRNGLANRGRARGERRIELVETLPLGGKRQLMLVLCDGQRVLVGLGGDCVHSITQIIGPAGVGFATSGMTDGLHSDQESGCN